MSSHSLRANEGGQVIFFFAVIKVQWIMTQNLKGHGSQSIRLRRDASDGMGYRKEEVGVRKDRNCRMERKEKLFG